MSDTLAASCIQSNSAREVPHQSFSLVVTKRKIKFPVLVLKVPLKLMFFYSLYTSINLSLGQSSQIFVHVVRFPNKIEHNRTHKKFLVRFCSIVEHNRTIQSNDFVRLSLIEILFSFVRLHTPGVNFSFATFGNFNLRVVTHLESEQ